jgi:hypothetical protein
MSDGVHLAAKLWLPEGALDEPVPAILEYIPYRKGDFTAYRDSLNHRYFAGHGYACLRVDLRGSGDSEGILRDEYLQQELDDGEELLSWIEAQPWCNGSVGMIGISWGGFNGLQLAGRGLPQLKAIITICSTDDRYADDVHYMGGCLLTDNLSWASTMFAYNSCPPDPAIVGERWREMWFERLEESGLWLSTWLEHQHRDDYWRHGSVCEDFSSIKCPVFAVSGWADGYSNAVFRLLSGLSVPRKGLIGPWGHKYPHMGEPGPGIDFLDEALRWWDRWLKDIDNGFMQEPMLRVWMQDSVAPTDVEERRPGRWVAENQWPSPNITTRTFSLTRGALGDTDTAEPDYSNTDSTPLAIQSPLSVGLFAGKWCSYSSSTDLPSDQREEDGGALVFDSGPLAETVEILGAAEVELEVSSNKPVAMLAARLSDMASDQKTTRVTYGLLNLTHRDNHHTPSPLEPGKHYTIRIRLNEVAHTFRKNHHIRLALSTSYWPLAWPAPESAELTIYPQGCRFSIPVRPYTREDVKLRAFGPPESAAPITKTQLTPEQREWTVSHDLATNISSLHVVKDQGTFRLEEKNLELGRSQREQYAYTNYNYDTVRGEVHGFRSFKRGKWQVGTVTRTLLTSDSETFRIRADLDAYEGDSRVFSKSWDKSIPRNLV